MKLNQLSKCVGIAVLFLFSNLNAQSSKEIISNYLKNDTNLRNAASSLNFQILNEDKSTTLQANVVNVQQYYDNTPIYKSLAKAIIREGQVISFNNNFERSASVNIVEQKIDKSEAFVTALRELDIKNSDISLAEEKGDLVNLPDNKVASIKFLYSRNNNLIPAQLFFINQSQDNKFYSVLVSLANGEILEKNKMIDECEVRDFSGDHNHFENHLVTVENEKNKDTPLLKRLAATDATYNVFKFPIEAPTFGQRSLVSNPWDLNASPEGWHSNGVNNYTNTRGNNVYAYVDNNASNNVGFNPTSTTTGSLTFDFPFIENSTTSAYENRASAVTNLFYANNMIHDIMYKFGFTEETRNFQSNNFGKGGIQGDAVNAEAYDGSGYNNANFNSGYETTINGQNYLQAPRMQMYLWNYSVPLKQRLFYNDPNYSQRTAVNTGMAYFGRQIMETGITGDIAIPSVTNACTAIPSGSLTGKIAIVTYTGCSFDTKTKNTQSAGAIGTIIYRNNSLAVTDMQTSGVTNINIPTIMLPRIEGDFIIAEINDGKTVNVTLKDLGVGYKNSSFDNGVMIHEYGHGVSNRLTGQGYNCLGNLEQMGEGWSDILALILTNTPGYTADSPRGIATYSANQSTTALGIRSYRYSPNMSINPFTYANTNSTGGQPHAVGQIWATMLWDLHWKMAEKYGYNYDVTADPNSGSAKTLQLIMDGLKLQPCNPDFVSGRDAILQADALAGGNDRCVIWNAFARRGLGLNASAGTAASITDQVEDFSVPQDCILATSDITKTNNYSIYPNPAKGEFFVKSENKLGSELIKINILDASGKLVKTLDRKKNNLEAISTKGLEKGIYLVVISENGKSITQKLIVE